MNALRRLTISSLVAIALVLTGGDRASADEDETVLRIRELWRQRQHRWDRAYFECSGTAIWHMLEHTSRKDLKVWLDLSANRLRRERAAELPGTVSKQFSKRFEVFLYNGQALQTYEPRAQNTSAAGGPPIAEQPELILRTDESWFLAFESTDMPIFFAIGNVKGNPKDWREPVEEGNYSRVTTVQHDNRECQVLRSGDTDSFSELWVDVERDAAIVRALHYTRGKLVGQIDVDYRQVNDAWLPSGWTARALYPDGSVWKSEKLNVERIDVDLDLGGIVFHMEPVVGMVVGESDGRRWVLNRDGTKKEVELPRSREAEVVTDTPVLEAAVRWYRRWGLVIVACLVSLAIASAGASWWLRRERH